MKCWSTCSSKFKTCLGEELWAAHACSSLKENRFWSWTPGNTLYVNAVCWFQGMAAHPVRTTRSMAALVMVMLIFVGSTSAMTINESSAYQTCIATPASCTSLWVCHRFLNAWCIYKRRSCLQTSDCIWNRSHGSFCVSVAMERWQMCAGREGSMMRMEDRACVFVVLFGTSQVVYSTRW